MNPAPSGQIPLNPEQEAAVRHEGGPLLVLAPAGSGKTRVVIERLLFLIGQSGLGGESFFVATFTRKAARELVGRIAMRLPGARLPFVGTFHSLSARLLRRFAENAGLPADFTVSDSGDQKTLVREIMRAHKVSEEDLSAQDILRQISRWKNARQRPEPELARRLFGTQRFIATCYGEYEEGLKRNRSLDYDDLLCRLVALLSTDAEVAQTLRREFHHLLVDEYQDTNPLQEELIRLLSRDRKNVTVVGDDDQSIYRFRGAEVAHIQRFGEHYPGASRVLLARNYRSTPSIVSAASAVIKMNDGRYSKAVTAVRGAGRPLVLCEYPDEEAEARGVAARLREWISGGGSPAQAAVLFRTNAQSIPLEKALTVSGVPFFKPGGGGLLDSREARDLLAYLRLLANPHDRLSLLRILNVPPRGQGDEGQEEFQALGAANPELSVTELLKRLSERGGRRASLSSLAALLEEGSRAAGEGRTPLPLLERVVAVTGYREWIGREKDDEIRKRRLGTLDELLSLAGEFRADPEISDPSAPPLQLFLEELALSREGTEEGSRERVGLMTIHQSKGLEFDLVMVVGVEDQILPFRSFAGGRSATDVEEERRLFYVAMTRARERLHLSWARTRRLYGKTQSYGPSPFLRDIPEEHAEGDRPEYVRPASGAPSSFNRSGGGREEGGRPAWTPRGGAPREAPASASPRRAGTFEGASRPFSSRPGPASPGGSPEPSVPPRTEWPVRREWVGRKVLHPRFGEGLVIDARRPDPDLEVVVRFADGQSRTLLARLANLTPADEKGEG